MGLLNFFKKATSTKSPFSNLFNLDLSELLNNSTVYKEHKSQDGTLNSIEYEVALVTVVLNSFDTIRIRLGSSKKEINNETPTILTFLSKNKQITSGQAEYIVNQLLICCNIKDDNWTYLDSMGIDEGAWRGRSFFLNENMVSIELDEQYGLTLSITGYQNYL